MTATQVYSSVDFSPDYYGNLCTTILNHFDLSVDMYWDLLVFVLTNSPIEQKLLLDLYSPMHKKSERTLRRYIKVLISYGIVTAEPLKFQHGYLLSVDKDGLLNKLKRLD